MEGERTRGPHLGLIKGGKKEKKVRRRRMSCREGGDDAERVNEGGREVDKDK